MRLHSISWTLKRSIILTSHRIYCCGNRPKTLERNLQCDRMQIKRVTRLKYIFQTLSERHTWHFWLKIKRYSLNLHPGYCAPELLQSSRIYSSNNKPEYERERVMRCIATVGAKRERWKILVGSKFSFIAPLRFAAVLGATIIIRSAYLVVYWISIKQQM